MVFYTGPDPSPASAAPPSSSSSPPSSRNASSPLSSWIRSSATSIPRASNFYTQRLFGSPSSLVLLPVHSSPHSSTASSSTSSSSSSASSFRSPPPSLTSSDVFASSPPSKTMLNLSSLPNSTRKFFEADKQVEKQNSSSSFFGSSPSTPISASPTPQSIKSATSTPTVPAVLWTPLIDPETRLYYRGSILQRLPEQAFTHTRLLILVLSDVRLPSLPDEIGFLTSLQSLYCSGNGLRSLPAGLGKLAQLEDLSLSKNELTDEGVARGGLQGLVKLRTLLLNDNQLTTVPTSIATLTKLVKLSFADNRISSVSESIGLLTSLSYLSFNNNTLEQLGPCLLQLPRLRCLAIAGNAMEVEPAELGALRCRLLVLQIERNGFLKKKRENTQIQRVSKLIRLSAKVEGAQLQAELSDKVGEAPLQRLTKLARLSTNLQQPNSQPAQKADTLLAVPEGSQAAKTAKERPPLPAPYASRRRVQGRESVVIDPSAMAESMAMATATASEPVPRVLSISPLASPIDSAAFVYPLTSIQSKLPEGAIKLPEWSPVALKKIDPTTPKATSPDPVPPRRNSAELLPIPTPKMPVVKPGFEPVQRPKCHNCLRIITDDNDLFLDDQIPWHRSCWEEYTEFVPNCEICGHPILAAATLEERWHTKCYDDLQSKDPGSLERSVSASADVLDYVIDSVLAVSPPAVEPKPSAAELSRIQWEKEQREEQQRRQQALVQEAVRAREELQRQRELEQQRQRDLELLRQREQEQQQRIREEEEQRQQEELMQQQQRLRQLQKQQEEEAQRLRQEEAHRLWQEEELQRQRLAAEMAARRQREMEGLERKRQSRAATAESPGPVVDWNFLNERKQKQALVREKLEIRDASIRLELLKAKESGASEQTLRSMIERHMTESEEAWKKYGTVEARLNLLEEQLRAQDEAAGISHAESPMDASFADMPKLAPKTPPAVAQKPPDLRREPTVDPPVPAARKPSLDPSLHGDPSVLLARRPSKDPVPLARKPSKDAPVPLARKPSNKEPMPSPRKPSVDAGNGPIPAPRKPSLGSLPKPEQIEVEAPPPQLPPPLLQPKPPPASSQKPEIPAAKPDPEGPPTTEDGCEAASWCASCQKGIGFGASFTSALGRTWHPDCFVCQLCKRSLSGVIFEIKGLPYCEDHYCLLLGLNCRLCGKKISVGSFLAVGDMKYHEECFHCTSCGRPLHSSFHVVQGELYCPSCR